MSRTVDMESPSSGVILSLYIDERRGVQGNTSMRSREFPRAQPEGTPETDEALAIAIDTAMSRAIAMFKPRTKKEED